ncbi:hypothetical protein GCM10009741_09510 [Kribbella lupini]|uniref:Uncharacterized protein n=1 Tax=Kribbella lupini TaxID=291602 RepID=A0ABN2A8C7_9ACTN
MPAGPNDTAIAAIHSTSTTHLDTLPHGNAASRPIPLIRDHAPWGHRPPAVRRVNDDGTPGFSVLAAAEGVNEPGVVLWSRYGFQPVRAAHSSAGR